MLSYDLWTQFKPFGFEFVALAIPGGDILFVSAVLLRYAQQRLSYEGL